MSKVSKNQRAKKPEANKEHLDRRNYQCSNLSSHQLFFAENEEEAHKIAKTLLGVKNNETYNLSKYGTKK